MRAPVNVLLIEDDPADARLVQKELADAWSTLPVCVDWTASVQGGLERLAANCIDAVLLDLSLPDSHGLNTLHTILQRAPRLPVIVMTGLSQEEVGMQAVQAGAHDFLVKGKADGNLLRRAIQDGIERKQMAAQLADAHEFIRSIWASSPIGILTYRFSGECVSANAFAAQMLESTVALLERQNFRQLPAWKRSGLCDLAEQAMTSREPAAGDVCFTTTSGKDLWVRAQFVIFKSGGADLLLLTFVEITDRKQAELELQASQEWTQNIIQHSTSMFYAHTAEHVLTYVSPQARLLLDCEPEEAMVRWHTFLSDHPANRLGIEATERALQTGQRQPPYELELCTARGRRIWVLTDESPVVRDGRVTGIVGSVTDITARKDAEAALDASEKRFRSWIENSSDLVTVLDTSGIVQYQSPSLKRILGYEPEDLLGQNAFEYVHADDVGQLSETFATLVQNPESTASSEFRFRHRDGSWRLLEATGRVYIDEHKELVAQIHSRDITERRRAEEARRDSETLYRAVMENSVEAIYLHGVQSKRVIAANSAFKNLLGYQEEEVEGLRLQDIVAHDEDSIDCFLQKVLAEGGVFLGERNWRCKDGRVISMEVTANCLKQSDQDVIFVVGRNITERKRAEQELREKEDLLSEAQRIGHVGSWSYDVPQDVLKFSDEMYRLLDVLPEDFHHDTKDLLALIYPSDRPPAAKWLEDIRLGRPAKKLDFRIFRKNGELRYLQCTGALKFDASGKAARFIGMAQDITDRRVAELQIDQQLKRLTALAEIDRAIMSSFDLRYTLGVILSHVISQLQVDAVDVLLLDPQKEALDFVAGQGFRTRLMEDAHVPLGASHAGRASKEQRMVRIPDLREVTSDPGFHHFVMQEGFVGYVAVPLIVKGKLKGVLEVYQRSLMQPYQEWLDFFSTLAGQTAIAIENASLFGNLQSTNQELIEAYDAAIEGWSRAMDLRDRETEGHTQRVTKLAVQLARAMQIDESRIIHIRRGALLHDIGKLGVPDHILFKQGELTPEEWEIMRQHTEFAYDMLSPIAYLQPALPIPYCHHERWDGSGYPLGLKGEQIPLEARIFALVDVWDALRSDRPYRKAWSFEKTLDFISEHAGTHFDPAVVACFLKVIRE